MQHIIHSIGVVQSPYQQKFGVPRQPGLVPKAEICICLHSDISAESIRGLSDFDYIWLHFIFHQVLDEPWSPLVRPPRLGGKQKMGVFATRSPHRPNYLGLSLLKLERIDISNGIKIYCSGADLVDGTPVIDIKPYLPFVESHPNAASGFVSGPPPELKVVVSPEIDTTMFSNDLIELAKQSIAQDPRPAYQNIPERIYVMSLNNHEIHFQIQEQRAVIIQIIK